jgi:VanZ family protein
MRTFKWGCIIWAILGAFVLFNPSWGAITFPLQKIDKIGHACLFLVGSIIFIKDLGFKKGIILSLGVAIITEFLQSLVPHRSFSWTDMIMNIIGICIGLLLVILQSQFTKSSEKL